MIFNSVLHLLLFTLKLPFISIRFVYRSFVYVCFSLPIKGGKYILGSVGNVYDRAKVWKYGHKEEEEKEKVIEGADADDQIRPPSPNLRKRRISSSSDYSVDLSLRMAEGPLDYGGRKDSCPDLYPRHSQARSRPSSRVSTLTRPIKHSRSHDNILDVKDSDSPYKFRGFEKVTDDSDLKSKIPILITQATTEFNPPEVNSETPEPRADTPDSFLDFSELQSPLLQSPLMAPDFDPSLDRSTQVYEFKSQYWYRCLFVHHSVEKNDDVSLVGDFNGWNISSHKMCICPEGYVLSVDLLSGRYEYKFYSDGNFFNDAHNPHVSQIFENSVIYVSTDPKIDHAPFELEHPQFEYSRLNSTFFHFQIRKPPVNGQLKSFGVLERPVYIYLPPNYSDQSKRFPVIYAHDGQSLFSSGIHGWHLDGMLDDLWSNGVVMEFILIAVPNGDDIQPGHRIKEYCPRNFNQSNPFLEYIVEVVKPCIDTNYRTVPDASHTFTLGSSLGGLFSFYLATTKPKVFSGAICIAPSLWFHDESDFSAFDFMELTRDKAPMCRLYLDSGRGEEDNFYVTRSMAETLGDLDWIPEKDFMYHLDTSEPIEVDDYKTTHHHHLWRERIPGALNFILSPLQD